MIGNDVVDLRLAATESNWQREGFLQKIFTKPEQDIIAAAFDPETCVWVLWSMKEAAYKIYNRETGIRAYIPHLMECKLYHLTGNTALGMVNTPSGCYFTETTIDDEIIHTVAFHPSKSGKTTTYTENEVIKDANGLPFIKDESGRVLPVSKSHHGRCIKVVALL